MIETDYPGLTRAILTELLQLSRDGEPIVVAHIEIAKFAIANCLAGLGPDATLEFLRTLEAQIISEFPHDAFPPTQGNA